MILPTSVWAGGDALAPLTNITGAGVGGKSIAEITEADIRRVTPYPGYPWRLLKGPKKDFGNWLSIFQLECSYHDFWDPLRSPEDFKAFERMGVDAITAHIEAGGSSQNVQPLFIAKPEDINLLYSRWTLQTGRGLIPAIMFSKPNNADGQVFYTPTYDGERKKPHGLLRCYSSPRTIEGNIARLRGNMAALGELAVWNGRPLVMFEKEMSKWMCPVYGADGKIQWGCYCPYCVAGYRNFLAKQFSSIAKLNAAAGTKYSSFEDILPPPLEMRYQMPVLFHYWIEYREWVRLAVVDELTLRCGALNVQCDSTHQFGMWYHGVESGYNPWRGALANDIVNLCIADGSLFAPSIGVAATVDAVLRNRPEKRALVLWGGYPTEEGMHPTLFHRRIAEMFAHVTNLRGSMWLWWENEQTGFDGYHTHMRSYPEMADAYAWWSAFGENQAELLKGMKTAMPEIASYWARTQTIFDPLFPPHVRKAWIFTERSKFWNWNFLAFWLDQYPVHCLFPEQVEAGEACKYKVLYALYGPRNTAAALGKIQEFHDAGGFVYGSYDALTRDLRDSRPDVFKQVFGCEPAPGGMEAKPIYNAADEFPGPRGYYEITRAHPALPPVGTRIPFMSGIQVVNPLAGAEVYGTYEGKPCIVGAKRSLYVGTDIAVDLAMILPPDLRPAIDEQCVITARGTDEKDYRNALKVLTGFAADAGVQRPVRVTRAGQPVINTIVGLLEKPGARLVTLTENRGERGAYELAVAVNAGEKVWDLTRNKPLEQGTNGNYRLDLGGYDMRLILIAGEKTVAEAAQRQEAVEREGRSWPYRLSRYFFVREDDHGRAPANGHYIHKPEDVYHPAAVIVVPDTMSAAVAAKVQALRELVRKLSRKEIAHNLAEPAPDEGATLPIVSAGKPNAEIFEDKNTLWIGSGKLNPPLAEAVTDEYAHREIRAGRIVTIQKYPWRSGGNVMVVPGENEAQLLRNLSRLYDDLVIWFNNKRCPAPAQYLAAALQRFVESLGWTVVSKGAAGLELTRPDQKRTTCWVYSSYDDNFAEILKELRRRDASQAMVVYACDSDLQRFKNKLIKEGWKLDKKNRDWTQGGERLHFSLASTGGSLNAFLRGMWPE